MKTAALFLVFCFGGTLSTLLSPAATSAHPESPFTAENSPAEKEFIKLSTAASKELTIRQLTLLHHLLIERCLAVLPDEVKLSYAGALATDNGRRSVTIENNELAGIVTWSFEGKVVVLFNVWLSLEKATTTVTSVKVDEKVIFVNVGFVNRNASVDDKVAELGGLSVRTVLENMQRPKK